MKSPGSLPELQRRMARVQKSLDFPADRFHQRVSSELFCELLNRAQQENIIPMFILKGGMAMELRFGIRARASGDIDVGLQVPLDRLINVLDSALEIGFEGFTFQRRGEALRLSNASTYRLDIVIAYFGKPFGILSVDLNEANYESESDITTSSILGELGIASSNKLPLLNIYTQIAHKIHGATEPSTDEYINRRYRDVLDVLICLKTRRILTSRAFERRSYRSLIDAINTHGH